MKILLMTWKDPRHPLAGGAELVNAELCQRLVRDGHEVVMLTGGFKGGAPTVTIDGYQVVRLGNRYTLWFEAFRYYMRNLRTWPDIVIEEVNTAPFFTAWYARQPKVLFFHQLCREIWFYQLPLPFSLIGYVAEPLYLRLLGRGPVITVSQSVKTDLTRYGFNPRQIHIISEGIRLQPLKTLNVQKYNDPTLLSFGAIRAMKRTLHHIEAFDIAKKLLPNLKLIVAGASEGDYGAKVLARIQHSPYAADITVYGRPTDTQKAELFKKSHAFLVTSLKEGWGLVVTEAASQGTPSVVYDVDGLRDSVRHNQTGLVVAPHPEALAHGVVTLLQNDTTYQAMRRAGWRWSKHITFDQSYRDFTTVLQKVLPQQTFVLAEQPVEVRE